MPTDIDILRKIDRIHPYPAKFPVDLAMNYICNSVISTGFKAFRIQLLLPKRTAAKILTKRNYKKNYGSYIIFGAAL